MRVLLVEDNDELVSLLVKGLARSGFSADAVANAGDAAHSLAAMRYAAIVLDLGLPDEDGLSLLRSIRGRGDSTPVLVLTARDGVSDRVNGLRAGADDYLVKPFDVDELVARVRALLRRSTLRDEELLLRVGTLHLDTVSRDVSRDGTVISLTQKEYALLEYLMRHAGRAVTREQIAEHVWKTEFDPSTNIVDVYINYLRKKIDGTDGPQLLHTVRGTGYMLRA